MNQKEILHAFCTEGTVSEVKPLGNGLINDTFLVTTTEPAAPDYVLQRINISIFTDVEMLQRNIERVTEHIRRCGEATLRFIPTDEGRTYHRDAEGNVWRVSEYIPHSTTLNEVNTVTAHEAGRAFGHFEQMLSDLAEPLGYTIPNFHNMEYRMEQLRQAVREDPLQRAQGVSDMLDIFERDAERMCQGERLHREGRLPLRTCHCDTKVNNMLFDDRTGQFLMVIDLDTVMPSLFFSDYGDFLRTAASTTREDDPRLDNVHFRLDIFKAFTEGYIESVRTFFTPLEIELLPWAAELFPFMQSVRFLWAYILGNDYWKCDYPEHNLDRARNQLRLYEEVCRHEQEMALFCRQCYSACNQAPVFTNEKQENSK